MHYNREDFCLDSEKMISFYILEKSLLHLTTFSLSIVSVLRNSQSENETVSQPWNDRDISSVSTGREGGQIPLLLSLSQGFNDYREERSVSRTEQKRYS